MLFNEPSQTPYDLRFQVLGIPVRVHPMFWLVALLMGLGGSQQAVPMLIWVGVVFVSILIHELGHAVAALACGWQPWITLHAFGGLASYRPTYRSPRNQILISLAGPGAGFLFALLLLGFITASGHGIEYGWHGWILPINIDPFGSRNLSLLVDDLLYVNIFWGLVNLLPVYPLDGGKIATEVLQLANPSDGLRQALWLSVVVAAVIAALAFLRLHNQFLGIFFAYMAYTNYMTLNSMYGPGGGLGGYR